MLELVEKVATIEWKLPTFEWKWPPIRYFGPPRFVGNLSRFDYFPLTSRTTELRLRAKVLLLDVSHEPNTNFLAPPPSIEQLSRSQRSKKKPVEFSQRRIQIDGKTIKVDVWKLATSDRLHSCLTAYFAGAVGAIVVVDLANFASLAKMRAQVERLRADCGANIVIAIVGLHSQETTVDFKQQAIEYARENRFLFTETTEFSSLVVEETLKSLVARICSRTCQCTADSAGGIRKQTLPRGHSREDFPSIIFCRKCLRSSIQRNANAKDTRVRQTAATRAPRKSQVIVKKEVKEEALDESGCLEPKDADDGQSPVPLNLWIDESILFKTRAPVDATLLDVLAATFELPSVVRAVHKHDGRRDVECKLGERVEAEQKYTIRTNSSTEGTPQFLLLGKNDERAPKEAEVAEEEKLEGKKWNVARLLVYGALLVVFLSVVHHNVQIQERNVALSGRLLSMRAENADLERIIGENHFFIDARAHSSRFLLSDSNMSDEMRAFAEEAAGRAFGGNRTTPIDVAAALKTAFGGRFDGSRWHAVVGRSFGADVTHDRFIVFHFGEWTVLLFDS
ncbi:Tubulovesicle-associated protein [Aphelenchoides fujianensis]|nr:Tubulovesicle-associated protein [Aphelenchoides fujianensis]